MRNACYRLIQNHLSSHLLLSSIQRMPTVWVRISISHPNRRIWTENMALTGNYIMMCFTDRTLHQTLRGWSNHRQQQYGHDMQHKSERWECYLQDFKYKNKWNRPLWKPLYWGRNNTVLKWILRKWSMKM